MIINVCVCVSSCDWRPFPTEPGLGRAGGRLNHRSSAGVRLASASTSVHSHPLITQTVPTHQLFTVTNVSALKHFSPHYRAELHLQKLLCIYFLTDVYSLMLVRVHVRARVLESSEHSGSQLRSSQQPSVAQLNPYTHTPPPPPTLFMVPEGLMCTAVGHVLGTRGRRQAKAAAAPLHLYHLCYSSLSSPSTMV